VTSQMPVVRPRADRVDRLARRIQGPLLAVALVGLGPMLGAGLGVLIGPLDAFQPLRDAIMGVNRNPPTHVIVVTPSPLPVPPDVAASGSERRRPPVRAVAPVPRTPGPERRVTPSVTPQSPTTTQEPEPADTTSPVASTATAPATTTGGNDDQEDDE